MMNRIFIISLMIVGIVFVSGVNASDIPSGKQLRIQAEELTKIIDTKSLKKLIDDSPELVLVDIRTDSEIKRQGGYIDVPQNINIARGWLEFDIQQKVLDKDSPIVVYCGGGLRSPFAAKTLQDMGYTNVWNYSSGYLGWKKAEQ